MSGTPHRRCCLEGRLVQRRIRVVRVEQRHVLLRPEGFAHAVHEQNRGEHDADFDGDGQFDEHGQCERQEQHDAVPQRRAHQVPETFDLAHVPGHHEQYRGEARKRDPRREWCER